MSRGRGPRRRGSAWFFAAGIAVVVVIGVVAVAISRDSDDSGGGDGGSAEIAASVSLDGQALPVAAGGDDPALGLQAPVARGEDFAGAPVVIGEGGRPQLVVFLAHWCPHCQAEVPRLVAFGHGGGFPSTMDVVAVATGTSSSRDNYPPSEWLERERWAWPVLLDTANGSVANAYGVSGFPFFVLLDADGTVLARDSGELTDAQLRDLVALAEASLADPEAGDEGDDEGDDSDGATDVTGPTAP